MIKAIYFDWGQLFAEHAPEGKVKLEKILQRVGMSQKEFWDLWWKLYLLRSSKGINTDDEMDFYASKFSGKAVPVKEIIETIIENMFVPEEHIELAKERKKNYKIGILSNMVAEWILKAMEKYEIQNLFGAFVVSSDVGVRKPNALIYYEAVRRVGVKPEEIAFVSDEIADDLVAASGLGIKTIWLNREADMLMEEADKKVLEIYKPDATIKSLKELIPVIKEI